MTMQGERPESIEMAENQPAVHFPLIVNADKSLSRRHPGAVNVRKVLNQ
jgi:hypothetical protein